MKKVILSLLIALPFCDASAQYKQQFSPVETPVYSNMLQRKNYVPTPLESGVGSKGAAGNPGPRWYNHAQSLASYYNLTQTQLYSQTYTTPIAIWQDSSVRYTGTSSNRGITWLSAAEVFAPNTALYNGNTTTPNNRGKLLVRSESYQLDSVMIRGYYTRISGATGYNDTLILTFVSDSTAGTFSSYKYGGTILTDHGIDSFAAVLWSSSSYLKQPINQTSYSTTPNGGGATKYVKYNGQIKIPLTNATFIDSLSDGSQLIKAAVGITVPGTTRTSGGRVAMSVTFKSGTAYTSGTPITNYNFFSLMSHETDSAQFQIYPLTDQNMSYLVSKDTTNTQLGVTSGLNYYIPTIGFSSPAFDAEVHDISWKVSCTTCAAVGVNDVENLTIGNAYPNPANGTLTIPISVASAASVNVSISNLLGQVLKAQSFKTVSAGQSKIATFNTADLASGVYVYTVESDGTRVSNRVVIAH